MLNQADNVHALAKELLKKDPSFLRVLCIEYADKELINRLGREEVISAQDVAGILSVSIPSAQQLTEVNARFREALKNKEWSEVKEICDKFWFEKPVKADKAYLVARLSEHQKWKDLYQLEQAFKNEDYSLTSGPLPKSPETYHLEELARKMMQPNHFDVETVGGDDYFVFSDGTRFNWTQIRANSDLQHIELGASDFDAYQQFITSVPRDQSPTILPQEADSYREKLYRGHMMPDQPISLSEMQAINVYTGGLYEQMNGLMRDEPKKYDYRTGTADMTRSALVQSVMCASGLRKCPLTNISVDKHSVPSLFVDSISVNNIPVSYRAASYGTDKEQAQRIQAAATHGVIELEGFVSASTNVDVINNVEFGGKPVQYTFKNLRGFYIAPISQTEIEREFLIPPTQVQITDYQVLKAKHRKDDKHRFEASLVSELGMQQKPHDASLKTMLQLAKPEVVLSLLEEGTITHDAVTQAFPNNKNMMLAASRQDKNALIETHDEGVARASKERIDFSLLKIRQRHQQTGELPERLIRELVRSVSKQTESMNYLINEIKTNQQIGQAFGIEDTGSDEEKVSLINELMERIEQEQGMASDKETVIKNGS